MASSDRFGYEWEKYSELNPDYEVQFKCWVSPLTPQDVAGKRVLDAGCGMGRNSYWMIRWGAREVVAFDADVRSVVAARRVLREFPDARVHQQDVYTISWDSEFDIVFSIGVIHHLRDPRGAIERLVRAVKPGGTFLMWVYSREGNEWIVRFVNPVRTRVTSRLPVAVTHLLAYACSIPLWLFVKIFRGPSGYLKQLSRFSFRHIHSIVFDQLIPDIAHYWSYDEVRQLVLGLPLAHVRVIRPSNNMGWTLIATKQ